MMQEKCDVHSRPTGSTESAQRSRPSALPCWARRRTCCIVARSLLGLDATAKLILPKKSVRQVVEPLLFNLRAMLLPSGEEVADALHARRFDYLQLVLDLPDVLLDAARRCATCRPSKEPAAPVERRMRRTTQTALAVAAGAVGALIAARAGRPPGDRAGQQA